MPKRGPVVGFIVAVLWIASGVGLRAQPVTEAEAEAFLQALPRHLESFDPGAPLEWFDEGRLMARVWRGMTVRREDREALLPGMRDSLRGRIGSIARFRDLLSRGVTASVLGARGTPEDRTAVLRLTSGWHVDYAEFSLERSSDGRVRAADFRIANNDGSVAEGMRSAVVVWLADTRRGPLPRLLGVPRTDVDAIEELARAEFSMSRSEYELAARALARVPAAWADRRETLEARWRLALRTDDDATLRRTLLEIDRRFPGDRSVAIVLMGLAWRDRNVDEFVRRAAFVDAAMGGDPWLRSLAEQWGRPSEDPRMRPALPERLPVPPGSWKLQDGRVLKLVE